MILTGTLENAQPSPNSTPLERGYLLKKTLFASAEGERPSPHAYLIEQSANSFALSHFHHNAEFQIIVAGGGLFGRNEVRPFMVHYAGQQTGYGPLSAGPEGLSYLTLRPVTEFGIWYLPESREYMDRRIPKGQVHSEPLPPSDPSRLRSLGAPAIATVMAPRPSGLAAWRVQVPAGGSVSPPVHPGAAGCFHVVIGGSLKLGAGLFTYLGTVWVSNDEPGFALVAGEQGLDLLALQFPGNAWEFADPPLRRT